MAINHGQQQSTAMEEALRMQQEAAANGLVLDYNPNQQQLILAQGSEDDDKQQMLWQDEQERVRQYTMELLKRDPNIT